MAFHFVRCCSFRVQRRPCFSFCLFISFCRENKALWKHFLVISHLKVNQKQQFSFRLGHSASHPFKTKETTMWGVGPFPLVKLCFLSTFRFSCDRFYPNFYWILWLLWKPPLKIKEGVFFLPHGHAQLSDVYLLIKRQF